MSGLGMVVHLVWVLCTSMRACSYIHREWLVNCTVWSYCGRGGANFDVVVLQVGWWFKPWFYQHAETALKRGEFVEYIPTREYYHRHTRCLYWEGKLILPFGDQFWFRYLFGWMMPPKVSFLKATQVCGEREGWAVLKWDGCVFLTLSHWLFCTHVFGSDRGVYK